MMNRHNCLSRLMFVGLAMFVATVPSFAQPAPNGVEVLARGPVHEAYAEPAEQAPGAGPIIPRQPPAPIEELPPDQRPEGDNVQWMPGYWSWDDDRQDFIWISGFWRVPPPGRAWVPGSWRQAGEGYQWVGGFWNVEQPQQQAELEYLPPPPQPLEVAPVTPAPSQTHVYVPGCWVWRERYVWRPGFWIEHRPGWVWTPAHYRWTPVGYVFVDGYWDFPLADRGVLFAPVYVPPAVVVQPTFVYTPTFIVRDECMYGALFVRRGWGHYYFGDYFEPRYREVGFSAWCGSGVTIGVQRSWHYDPLFSYYSVAYRQDRFWGGGIHDVYVGRFNGTVVRPPRTLVQQNTIINNITVNNVTVNQINNTTINNINTNVNNVTMLANVNQVKQVGTNRLAPIPLESRQQQLAAARDLRQVSLQRANVEKQLALKQPPATVNPVPVPGQPNRINPTPVVQPQKVKLDLPKRPEPRPFAATNGQAPTPAKVPPPAPVKVDRPAPKADAIPPARPFSNPAAGNNLAAPKVNPPTPVNNPPARIEPKPLPKLDAKPQPQPAPRPFNNPAPSTINNPSKTGLTPPPALPKVNPPAPPKVNPQPAPVNNPVPLKVNPQPQPAPRPFNNPAPAAPAKVNPQLTPAPAKVNPPAPVNNPAPRINPAPVNNPAPRPFVNPAPAAPAKVNPPAPVKVNPPPAARTFNPPPAQPAPRPQPQPAPAVKLNPPVPAKVNPAPAPSNKPQPKPAPRPFEKKNDR